MPGKSSGSKGPKASTNPPGKQQVYGAGGKGAGNPGIPVSRKDPVFTLDPAKKK